jgi:uncharacterized membrane protein
LGSFRILGVTITDEPTVTTTAQISPTPKSRVQSVDALRGLIMIIMALDHTRDFFHTSATAFQPEDLTRTTTALFLTRWITHFCAPVFMFTAGIGSYFWLSKGRTAAQLSGFLAKRGLWLVFLDLTVIHYGLAFSFTSGPFVINVLWGLGWAMIALALLVHLPVRILASLSIAVIALHNLLDRFTMWPGLHQIAFFQLGKTTVVIAYTLIPWFAVMAAGYCFARVVAMPSAQRRQWMLGIGLALTIAFFVIRAINIYGDPVPWSHKFPGMTALSFLRVNKYPPSLDFLLMTLGPALMLLAWLDRINFSASNPLMIFGRVPLFFFLVHIYVLHALALFWPTQNLAIVYLWWVSVVAALYPLCLWFARVKARKNDWWLSYL